MMPRAILPNVIIDNLGLDVKFYIDSWHMIGLMIGVGIIFAGITIFADWFDLDKFSKKLEELNTKLKTLKKERKELEKRFALMTTEYANTVVKLNVDTSTSNVGIGTTGSGYKIKLKNKKHTKACDHYEQADAKELCQRCWNFRDEHKL